MRFRWCWKSAGTHTRCSCCVTMRPRAPLRRCHCDNIMGGVREQRGTPKFLYLLRDAGLWALPPFCCVRTQVTHATNITRLEVFYNNASQLYIQAESYAKHGNTTNACVLPLMPAHPTWLGVCVLACVPGAGWVRGWG